MEGEEGATAGGTDPDGRGLRLKLEEVEKSSSSLGARARDLALFPPL